MKDMLAAYFPLVCLLPPLFLAPFIWWERCPRAVHRLVGLSTIPAFLVAIFTPTDAIVDVPWLLLGTRFSLDTISQVFLFFTSFIWACSGIFANGYQPRNKHRGRFFGFFLLTMIGNLGITIVHDLASFYFFFSLMSFSSYGLVIHENDTSAKEAARVYLKMAIFGEMLLLCGFWLVADSAKSLLLSEIVIAARSSSLQNWSMLFLLLGFGIKAGLFPFHVWLPLAHPVAPTPASAVLSGCMIKAGLLGWLRFLPLGLIEAPILGFTLFLVGLLMSFGGVAVGLAQRSVKVVLAYSSISQMGFMAMALGAGLTSRESWPFALTAILVYAIHHSFAKSTLFLGVGLAMKGGSRAFHSVIMMLGLASISLAGAPLTSGAIAKASFKKALAVPSMRWPIWLDWLLPLTAVGTTVLMGRFMFLITKDVYKCDRDIERTRSLHFFELWLPWTAIFVATLVALWIVPLRYGIEVAAKWPPQWPPQWLDLIYSLWPIVLGLVLIWRIEWLRHHREPQPLIRPGDILPLFRFAQRHFYTAVARIRRLTMRETRWVRFSPDEIRVETLKGVDALDFKLTRWDVAGSLFCLLVVLLLISLIGMMFQHA